MNKKKLNLARPTPEEEEEITAQLAEDPDTYEWTNEDWANAQTTEELFPEAHEWALRQKKLLEASRTWPASIPIQEGRDTNDDHLFPRHMPSVWLSHHAGSSSKWGDSVRPSRSIVRLSTNSGGTCGACSPRSDSRSCICPVAPDPSNLSVII